MSDPLTSLASFRPIGRTLPAIDIRRSPGNDGQFGRHCIISRRGEQIAASATVTATFSRGHAYVRSLRDGQPNIARPMDIPMRKPPHRPQQGGGAFEGGLVAAAQIASLRRSHGVTHARRRS